MMSAGMPSDTSTRISSVITEGFETTGSAGPTWGPMEFEVEFDIDRAQLGTLTVFESSAKDGSPTDIRETAVWLVPSP